MTPEDVGDLVPKLAAFRLELQRIQPPEPPSPLPALEGGPLSPSVQTPKAKAPPKVPKGAKELSQVNKAAKELELRALRDKQKQGQLGWGESAIPLTVYKSIHDPAKMKVVEPRPIMAKDPLKAATTDARRLLRKLYHSCINKVVDPRRNDGEWDKPTTRPLSLPPPRGAAAAKKKLAAPGKKKPVVPLGADDPDTMRALQAARGLQRELVTKLGLPPTQLPNRQASRHALPPPRAPSPDRARTGSPPKKREHPDMRRLREREHAAQDLQALLQHEDARRQEEMGAWKQLLGLEPEAPKWEDAGGDEEWGGLGAAFSGLDAALESMTLRPLDGAPDAQELEELRAAKAAKAAALKAEREAALAAEAELPKRVDPKRLASLAEPTERQKQRALERGQLRAESEDPAPRPRKQKGNDLRTLATRYKVNPAKMPGAKHRAALAAQSEAGKARAARLQEAVADHLYQKAGASAVEDYFREVELLQDARPLSRGRTASRASSAGRKSLSSRPRTASNADVADLDDLDELERRVRALEVPAVGLQPVEAPQPQEEPETAEPEAQPEAPEPPEDDELALLEQRVRALRAILPAALDEAQPLALPLPAPDPPRTASPSPSSPTRVEPLAGPSPADVLGAAIAPNLPPAGNVLARESPERRPAPKGPGSGTKAMGSGTKPVGSGTKPVGSGTKPVGSGTKPARRESPSPAPAQRTNPARATPARATPARATPAPAPESQATRETPPASPLARAPPAIPGMAPGAWAAPAAKPVSPEPVRTSGPASPGREPRRAPSFPELQSRHMVQGAEACGHDPTAGKLSARLRDLVEKERDDVAGDTGGSGELLAPSASAPVLGEEKKPLKKSEPRKSLVPACAPEPAKRVSLAKPKPRPEDRWKSRQTHGPYF